MRMQMNAALTMWTCLIPLAACHPPPSAITDPRGLIATCSRHVNGTPECAAPIGSQVRVRTVAAIGAPAPRLVEGLVRCYLAESMSVLTRDSVPVQIHLALVSSIERPRVLSLGARAGRGAGIGAAVGLVFGVATFASRTSALDGPARLLAPLGLVSIPAGVAWGGLVGGAVGSVIPGTAWTVVWTQRERGRAF